MLNILILKGDVLLMGKEKDSFPGTGKRPGLQQEFYVFPSSENLPSHISE